MRIKNVLQYLERTAARLPKKVAFCGDKTQEPLTFETLLLRAKQIGSKLCHGGLCGRGFRVAILCERGPGAVAAMLGVTYAGAMYLPLDADMPQKRLADLLANSQVDAILCDQKNAAVAKSFDLPAVLTEQCLSSDMDEGVLSAIRARQIDTDPLYMVFTSGSTGRPKGVVACHRSVIDYGEALTEALAIDETTVFGCQSPLYFDAPLKEILGTLMCGATTVFVPRRLFSFPVPLLNFLKEQSVNTICWVSSALSTVAALGALEVERPHLARVVFGSEVLPNAHYEAWRKALPTATFYQLYGPTEATGMSCLWRADRALLPDERIPIGAPLDNTDLLLIGEDGRQILPAMGHESKIGEMYLRGTCVTMGYDGDVDATAAAFVQHPLHHDYPETVYRTGDLARYNRYGELVFIGRRDGQLKRMGHRIEPGEVEAAALRSVGVTRAICLAGEQHDLLLFYTGDGTEASLMARLTEQLPRYYLPDRVIRMETFPLTDNGKIDRRALKGEAYGR